MPELPEVETVRRTLKKELVNKVIQKVDVYHYNIIAFPSVNEFKEKIKNQCIEDIKRRGKWLIFELSDFCLVAHLRMEGKFFLKRDEEKAKHEHVIFYLDDDTTLRYNDTRKFGKMYLIAKDKLYQSKPLSELGLEPWDNKLTVEYLKEKYKKKKLSIKTVLLDQSIITGIGNIYADEILYLSHLNPLMRASELLECNLNRIIENTRTILAQAIELGGTTIRSYESSEGVHGRFQNNLLVHNHENDACPNCGTSIVKTRVNGRGTYYCPKCQNKHLFAYNIKR